MASICWQEVEDDEVPPPPPDEPMPGELDLQLEMEAITAMDQMIQVLPCAHLQ